MSDSNYSVETEDHQSVKNLKNTFSNKEKKDNNITTPKNSQNLPLKQDANWVKKKKFSAGLTIQVNDDESPNPQEEIPNPKQNNSTTNAENNDTDLKERIKKFQQASSRKKEEITFEELKSRKYVKTTSFEYGGQDSGSTKNETAVEIVVEVRNRRITEKFEENYDDDDPSENQDDTDIHGHVKERVEYFEHIKGSGDPEYVPKGVHDWEGQQNYGESQRNYGESINEGNQTDYKRKDYASDISYETTYGKYKSPTFKEYNKTHKSPINKESVKTQQGENVNEGNPLDNKRRDYASDISYQTTYGKYKSPINKEYNKTHHGETVNASIQQENRRTDYTSDISYETTYGKYKSPLNKDSLKTPSANEGIQANNKRTDYAQDISYETTYGNYKSPANKESSQTVPHQVNQEFKSSSLPVEGSSMHKSGSTYASSSYQPPRIKVEKDPEIYQPTPSFLPMNISQDTSPNRTQIQTNKPKDDDSYFRLDTSAHNDDNYFGKTSSIVIIDNNFESSFQKENNKKKKEGCCSAFCKYITKIFKSDK